MAISSDPLFLFTTPQTPTTLPSKSKTPSSTPTLHRQTPSKSPRPHNRRSTHTNHIDLHFTVPAKTPSPPPSARLPQFYFEEQTPSSTDKLPTGLRITAQHRNIIDPAPYINSRPYSLYSSNSSTPSSSTSSIYSSSNNSTPSQSPLTPNSTPPHIQSLLEHCIHNFLPAPIYEDVIDVQCGQTAWTAKVRVAGITVQAPGWYGSAEHLEFARAEAAEVALRRLGVATRGRGRRF